MKKIKTYKLPSETGVLVYPSECPEPTGPTLGVCVNALLPLPYKTCKHCSSPVMLALEDDHIWCNFEAPAKRRKNE